MKGNDEVIKTLNSLLAGELTAIDQYFIHSRMYEDWGLQALYERLNHEKDDETQHADMLIKRILFLQGTPDLSVRVGLNIGQDVPSMLKNDLDLEYQVISDLKAAIQLCEQCSDYPTREILEVMLKDTEEDHGYWLEKQLRLIDLMGLNNYLQSQM